MDLEASTFTVYQILKNYRTGADSLQQHSEAYLTLAAAKKVARRDLKAVRWLIIEERIVHREEPRVGVE